MGIAYQVQHCEKYLITLDDVNLNCPRNKGDKIYLYTAQFSTVYIYVEDQYIYFHQAR